MKFFLSIAAIYGFFGILLGAVGAHALKGKISPNEFNNYRIGVEYLFFHIHFSMISTTWQFLNAQQHNTHEMHFQNCNVYLYHSLPIILSRNECYHLHNWI